MREATSERAEQFGDARSQYSFSRVLTSRVKMRRFGSDVTYKKERKNEKAI